MALYDVAGGNTAYSSDLDQLTDALTGKNDVTLTAFTPLSVPGAPTVAVNTTAGNLTGNYEYAVAFATGYWQGPAGTGIIHVQGNTGGGTASAVVAPSAQQVNLSAIPIGPTGVVQRVLYRTDANGSAFYYLVTLDDNTSTTYTDNTADSGLGAAMPTTNTTGTVANLWKLNVAGLATFNAGLTLPSGQTFANAGTISGGVVNPASGTVSGNWTANGNIRSGANATPGWLGIGDDANLIAKQLNYYSLIWQGGQAWGSGSTSQLTGTTLYLDGFTSGSAPAWGGWAALKSLGVNELQLAPGGSLTSQHNILDNGSGTATFAGLLTASGGMAIPSGQAFTNSGTYAGSPLVTSITGNNGITVANPTSPGAATLGLSDVPNSSLAGPLVTGLVATDGLAIGGSGVGAYQYSLVLNGTSLSNGASGLSLNLGNANGWTVLQTFSAGITGTGTTGALTAGSGILGTANTWTAGQTSTASFNAPALRAQTTQSGSASQSTVWVQGWTGSAMSGISILPDNSSGGAYIATAGNSAILWKINPSGNIFQEGRTAGVSGVSTAGNFGVATVVAQAQEVEITGTTAQTILSFTPPAQGIYEIKVYFRVVTGTTTVTVAATYDDVTGAQTDDILPATSEAVGSYRTIPATIDATTAAAITVQVTVSVANQVYATAVLIGY